MLQEFIKYFWAIKSHDETVVHHKLLPVSNIDIILNFSSPIKYIADDNREIIADKVHFNGIRDKYLMMDQRGPLDIIGISFSSTGVYPFLKIPLSEFKNKTIGLDCLMKDFTSRIEEVRGVDSIKEKIDAIEKELVKMVDTGLIPKKKTKQILQQFYINDDGDRIHEFCRQYGISQRQLERYFSKYIGINPKLYQRLTRFQKTFNTMMQNKDMDFTTLAYENDYYDQNHFIKEFKSFTGATPTGFFHEKKSVKEIMKVT